MPEIPQFIASQPEPFERDTATANPGAYAAAGNATQTLGRSIEGLGDAVGKLVEYHNTVAYNEALANAVTVGADNFESGKDEVRKTGNYQGFTQRQLAAFDQHTQQALQDAPMGVSARLERRFALERKQIQTRASGFEHQFGAESELANIGNDVDSAGTRLYRDPTQFDSEIGRVAQRVKETGDAGLLNPQQQQLLARKAGDTLALAAIRGRHAAGDAGLAADLEGGKYDRYLTPQSLERLEPVIDQLKGDQLGRQFSPRRGDGALAPAPPAGTPDAEIDARLAPIGRRENREGNPNLGFGGVDLSSAPHDATGFPIWGGRMGPQGISHAAGLFQIQPGTWKPIARQLGITDFSADSQRAVARELYRQQGEAPWAASAGTAAGSPAAAPNLDQSIAAIAAAPGYSDKQKDRAITVATRDYHQWHQAHAQDIAALEDSVKNGIAALQDGRDWTPDPVAITGLLPPEKATETLRTIDEARELGNLKNRVWFASPAELNSVALQAAAMKDRPQDYARALRYNAQLGQVIKQRDEALAADPAAYVRQAPAVEQAWSAVDPQKPDPAGAQAAVQASLAEQTRLGVPPEKQAALAKPQAAALVRQIATADPATTDIGQQLDGMQTLYGPHWNRVFGDLVKAGLPAEAQLLGAMDRPDQAAVRADFQTMLKTVAEKGGPEQLRKVTPHQAVQDIGQAIAPIMAPFRATTPDPKLYGAVQDAVQHLAEYYAFKGQSGDAAVKAAYDGILGRKYDFAGMVRAPKGQLGTVEAAGAAALRDLAANDVPDIGGSAELTADQRRGIYLDAVKNGQWATNADDSGIVRLARFRDGALLPARRADGSRIEIKFPDAPALAVGQSVTAPPSGAAGNPF
jgi:hypothetical protein